MKTDNLGKLTVRSLAYTTHMSRKTFSVPPTHQVIRLVLACALLFSAALDLDHQHNDLAGELQCYTCHYSPNLGLGADVGTMLAIRPLRRQLVVALPETTLQGRYRRHTARGPPLLT